MKYRVGSVPYLNAKPLVRQFEDLGDASPVSVVYDVPSRLPALLEAGEVQAILVSSIEALRQPDLHFADGVSICSQKEVFSVRLFSKVPFAEIRRLALDASSMTSNALAQILLDQRFGVRPATTTLHPDLNTMLAECDAGILIGDNGMRATSNGLHVLDLGLEWNTWTGLPFVWALWVGRDEVLGPLGDHLRAAKEYGEARLDVIARDAAQEAGLQVELCEHYLLNIMSYNLGPRERAGFERYREELLQLGLLEAPKALA